MSKIVIDARESGTSTGRYIDKLIEYLHGLKTTHEIIILTKPHRIDFFKNIAPMFTIIETIFAEFSFAEQLGFVRVQVLSNAIFVDINQHSAVVQGEGLIALSNDLVS